VCPEFMCDYLSYLQDAHGHSAACPGQLAFGVFLVRSAAAIG